MSFLETVSTIIGFSMSFIKRHKLVTVLLFLVVLYTVLLIPDSSPQLPPLQRSDMVRPFIWNQDARWDSLEASFAMARSSGEEALRQPLENRLLNVEVILQGIETNSLPPTSPEFSELEENFFSLAPLVLPAALRRTHRR